MRIAQSTGQDFISARRSGRLFVFGRDLYEEIARQKPQFFLWFPVLLSFGIGLYYMLPTEPPLFAGAGSLLFALALRFFLSTHPALKAVLTIVLLMTLGFAAAQTRTYMVHTPVLQKKINATMVTGVILEVEDMGEDSGSRLLLGDVVLEDFPANETPVRIRLKVRKDHGLKVGQRIEILGGLNPPSPPSMPGAFDFQRYLYFQRIGAVGFSFGEATIIEQGVSDGWNGFIEQTRQNIALRVEEKMRYPEAAIASALLMGRQSAISKEDIEAFRGSGLAHILSISGLHVGLLAGVIFFTVRLLMVLIPGFALKYPIKKFAAALALLGAFFYMELAGASVPTQRSVLMTGIVLLAVMLDRSPISLRLVAFAALSVLLFFPESLLSASFHMSFGAVTMLVAFFDWLRPYWSAWYGRGEFLRKVILYFICIGLTTLIAGTATAPFSLFHFQQYAVYGLPANFLAVPIAAFIIMPAVVATYALMPFGLDALALAVMQRGVTMTLAVAHWAAGLPHAEIHTSAWPLAALVMLVLSVLIAVLWKGHLRAAALVPAALFLSLVFTYRPPDILVSPSYKLLAFKGSDGMLHVSNRQKDRFVRENWAQAYGFEAHALSFWPREGRAGDIACGADGCRIFLKGYEIAYTDDPLSLRADCAQADIVLSAIPVRRCAAGVIDLMDTKYRGAHAVWLEKKGPVIRSAESERGARPWSSLNKKF